MDASPEEQRRNRANVILLGVVSFINDTSSKIIVPLPSRRRRVAQ